MEKYLCMTKPGFPPAHPYLHSILKHDHQLSTMTICVLFFFLPAEYRGSVYFNYSPVLFMGGGGCRRHSWFGWSLLYTHTRLCYYITNNLPLQLKSADKAFVINALNPSPTENTSDRKEVGLKNWCNTDFI